MKYRGYEGPAEELVRQKLEELQEKEHVRVLHAVESGSRAWGFASPDSDYDVRFVYVRPLEYYLGLEAKKDTLEWEMDEVLDINGWDLSKALQHFHKSNATLFEWSQSPIVYRTTSDWQEVRAVSREYFSCKSAMYHYYGTARKNYAEYLTGERVRYKKYFYVLRPLLACRWIEKKALPPPVPFRDLCREVLEEEMRPAVENLLAEKMRMSEGEEGERLDRINEFILRELNYYKEKTEQMADDRNTDWEDLDRLFRRILDVK